MYIRDLPYHVVQRVNNREACFIEEENYKFYLELCERISRQKGVDAHAYCLVTNHIKTGIDLFITPHYGDRMKIKVIFWCFYFFINQQTQRILKSAK